MAYYKVQVNRQSNPPKIIVVKALRPQEALTKVASELRDEGITDARTIEVIGQVASFRG
ncbi:hypothetical protein [Microcoleus sp. OTE_8_concoct_300]|uniref:hypothetical protein n=1 Tax=Microcoleus sp. OTE_8_concoct_300 TaxID=2964710 RepID=UPI00403F4737